MIFIILIYFIFCGDVFATQISYPTTWGVNDTVTNVKLNNNNNAITAVVNGNLDNTNMASSYFLYQSVAALPSAGTQGRVDFLTTDNSINLDNGSAWLKTITPTGTLATGQFPYYNSGWALLSPGAQYYSLVSNGVSSLPSYQQISLTNGITGTLSIANGGTGQVTAQAAVDALLPSQASASGKFLTSNGSASSWGSSGLTLVSNTTVSAAATTGNIAIDGSKYYRIVFNLGNLSAADFLIIRFNADSGAHYKWVYDGRTTGGAITGGATGAAGITMSTAMTNSIVNYLNGDFQTFPQAASSVETLPVSGQIQYTDNAAGLATILSFGGSWTNAVAATSFVIISNGGATFSGNVLVYKLGTT